MSREKSEMLGFATRAVHAELTSKRVDSRPLATPIFQTSSFEFDHTAEIADAIQDPRDGYVYSRLSNPTLDALEQSMARLEGGEAGLALASGMAAVNAALVGLCSQGDHIVAPRAAYGGTFALMSKILARLGIETTFVENDDLDAWRAAVRDTTKVVYAETIANPILAVADLDALSEIAHSAGALLIVDSTFATPYLCRPIEHGADLVIHSASKYLGGHGDLIGGILVGSTSLLREIRETTAEVGGAMAPFVAWLVLRGLKTLALRMERHSRSAERIAAALTHHDAVARVIYPGHASHPQHALAQRMLPRGSGGMIAFEVHGGREQGVAVMDRFALIKRAASLGDTQSLALQPAATSHRQLSPDELRSAGISEGFIRLSVGLEDAEDLIADLEQALSAINLDRTPSGGRARA